MAEATAFSGRPTVRVRLIRMQVVINAVLAVGAMFMKDSINTILVIMEARGRSKLAGNLAAASDVSGLLVTLTSAGLVLRHGWTLQTIPAILAMMVASKYGTQFWTGYGNRIAKNGEQGMHELAHAEVPDLARRLAALEQAVQDGDRHLTTLAQATKRA